MRVMQLFGVSLYNFRYIIDSEVYFMIYETFTAANSAYGFFSYFDELTDITQFDRVYLIKGGPGTGKSTFMRKIAHTANSQGLDVEMVYCSSDLQSLDGVRIPQKRLCIFDATAPHSYDTKYPGAFDSIINLGQFWDEAKLSKSKKDIINIMSKISGCYSGAYNILKAAGALQSEYLHYIESISITEKIQAQIKKIIRQNAITASQNKSPRLYKRLVSAIGPGGVVTKSSTLDTLCSQAIVLDDSINLASNILSRLQSYFIKIGYDVIAFYSPLLPKDRLEHIIVPELGLGIISQGHIFDCGFLPEQKIIKTIHTKNLVDKELYGQNKNKLNFLKKMSKELVCSATQKIGEAKVLHDQLEQYYIKAMDFDGLNEFASELSYKILR